MNSLFQPRNTDAEFVKDNDSIIFFNFRPDRARQLTHLFIGSNLYDVKPKHPVKYIKVCFDNEIWRN